MNRAPEELRALEVYQCMAEILQLPKYTAASFDNYLPSTPRQAAALAKARQFVDLAPWYEQAVLCNSLLLLGPPGTGKTHLAAAVLHADVAGILKHYGREEVDVGTYLFIGHAELMRRWRDAVRARSESDFISKQCTPHIVVVDDFRQPRHADDEEGFAELVEARYSRGCRPFVITSNLNLPLLKQAIGARAFDRLGEGALLAVVDGESHRQPFDDAGPRFSEGYEP